MRTLTKIRVPETHIYEQANRIIMGAINSVPTRIRKTCQAYKFFGHNHETGGFVFLVMEDKGAWFESTYIVSGSFPSDDDAPRHALEAARSMNIDELEMYI